MPSVYLQKVNNYSLSALESTVQELLQQALSTIPQKQKILIKPNFISRQNSRIACTHPALIRAACVYFKDLGNSVFIGDSPAFGSAQAVARRTGLSDYISDLDIPVINLKNPISCPLLNGNKIGISAEALQTDLIVNMPKLKAHSQMRVSGAVKNLFGCVPGMRKALAHARYGERGHYFEEMFFSILQKLPKTINILDGIQAMHKTGPIHGSPLDFELLAVSNDPIALDTAIYKILKLEPEQVPLWAEARRLDLKGAFYRQIEFPGLTIDAFSGKDFHLPRQLKPVSFRPFRLFVGALKRIKHWLAGNIFTKN